MVHLKRDYPRIVQVVQPRVVSFLDVPQIAAYHNKLLEALHSNKVRINAIAGKKLSMSALLGNLTLVDNINPIGIIDCAEAVRNDY